MPSLAEIVAAQPEALLPHQRDVLTATSDYIVIHGGVGAAKTRACLWRVFLQAQAWAGQTLLIGALTQRHLEDVIVRPWLDEMPESRYHYSPSRAEIRVPSLDGRGESMILLRSLERSDSVARIRGLTLTGYYLAQAELLPEAAFHELEQRVRSRPNGVPFLRLFDANAGATTHWLYRHLLDPHSESAIDREWVTDIHVRTADNPSAYSPRQLAVARRTLSEGEYQRQYDGVWGEAEGRVYTHVPVCDSPPEPDDVIRYWVGLDPGAGGLHPFAMVWLGEVQLPDGRSQAMVLAEHEVYNQPVQQVAGILQAENARWGETKFQEAVIDWSGLAAKRALIHAGIPVVWPTQDHRWKRVAEGVRLVDEALRMDVLSVSPACPRTLRDAQRYVWDDQGSEPDKSAYDAHLLDALRYVFIRVGRQGGLLAQLWHWEI